MMIMKKKKKKIVEVNKKMRKKTTKNRAKVKVMTKRPRRMYHPFRIGNDISIS